MGKELMPSQEELDERELQRMARQDEIATSVLNGTYDGDDPYNDDEIDDYH